MPVRTCRPDTLGRRTDGEWADIAFGLGELYEHDGDLEQAAEWFRRAAECDRQDAALRLGDVLGRLADQGDGSSEERLAEATRWLSGAQGATGPDAIGLITDMLNRHQRQAARRGLDDAATG
ncbi:hypothetical protein [Spirillospora sp. CA-294931]|uniref:hypothetical protein n=1 Tax=Spirillospora sp. CA-294931 TaxID=3240042 RepID=UPI003D8D8CE9